MLGKKKISNFGKIYQYLQDVDLRVKEAGKQRITIKGAVFSNERFDGGDWGHFDFVDCDFKDVGYNIRLRWLVNCTFTNCNFIGGYPALGHARDVKFMRCSGKGEIILGFSGRSTGLIFEQCSFVTGRKDNNRIASVISDGEISFIDCKSEWFDWGGYKKLTLKKCVTIGGRLSTSSPGNHRDISQMPYSDFLLEDCDFTRGVGVINLELNSLTMRNCKIGLFETWRSVVRGDTLIEGIKGGHLDLLSTDFDGKLVVRNCSFLQSYRGYSFRCPGIVAAYTLIENIVCGSDPANVSGAPEKMTEEKRLPKTLNKSLVIRNCKIPRLHVDWAQTEHLRIENCELKYLYIRNGRIGKLEIIECSLMHLDVSDTQVQSQDVRIPEGGKISGHVTVTKGSNIKLLPK